MRFHFTAMYLAATLAMAAVQPALGQTAIISTPGGVVANTGSPAITYGWSFTTNIDLTVTALGINVLDDQLAASHQVGIWEGATLLGSVTVPGGGTPGSYSYVSVATPFTLVTGTQYRIGAFYNASIGDSFLVDTTSVVTSADVNYLQGAFQNGGFLAPASDFAGNRYFGPNFQYVVAPEPQGWAMMLAGFAVAGTALRRRNRRAALPA